ncbi:MAG: hypothetical protein ABR566_05760 [Pyrinomonadaceae bacterium]
MAYLMIIATVISRALKKDTPLVLKNALLTQQFQPI